MRAGIGVAALYVGLPFPQIFAHSDIRAAVFRLLSNLVKVIAKNVSNNMGAILKFSKIALQFLCAFHIFKLES